jgi:nucleoside-diphosphate-sugar epimerase
MWRTNVTGTETVLAAARRAGVGRIGYVSTFGALLPATGDLGPDSPVGRARDAYLASKAAAETIARRHQADGAPVAICYPPGLLGPGGPRLGDQRTRLRDLLRGLLPVWPRGGVPLGDVRDTASALVGLLADGPVRRFAPGRLVGTERYVRAVRELTGRRLPAAFLPAGAMLPLGAAASALQRMWPWHIPAEHGAIYVCAHARWTGDASGTPFETTLADTVRWLHDTGHVTARQAGSAATVTEAAA